MSLEQLANIAEVFGLLIVAVTLIFLTLQLRQNTKALRSTSGQHVNEIAVAIYGPIVSNSEVADILLRGMSDPDALMDVETIRFTAHWHNSFSTWQNFYFQWREGVLDEGIWHGWSRILTDIYQVPGIRSFWHQRRQYFSDEFRDYLETDLFPREPSPNYKMLNVPTESSAPGPDA